MKKFSLLLIIFALISATLCGCNNDEEEDFLRQIAEYRAAKIAAYEDENEKYADFQVDVAFIGDSLTDGYDVAAYYPDLLVSNRGIGGDTTFDLEGRLAVSLYDLQPKVVVMLIGVNNIGQMFENYERILVSLREHLPNTKIVLLSLTSMSGDWGKNNQLAAYNNVKIKLLAEKYSYEYVDLYSALLNLESGEIYPEYTTDGGHLTPLGYEVLTRKITPVVKAQLALWQQENSVEN
jgi:lysophospholipase L1-like esterase